MPVLFHSRKFNSAKLFIEFYYNPGPNNVLANALSRHPDLQPDFADAKQEFTTTLLAPKLFRDLPNFILPTYSFILYKANTTPPSDVVMNKCVDH
jgi:hypothetical protein